MMSRPVIGLTMRVEAETRRFYLGRDYCEALESAGGVPFHIPPIAKREYIESIMDRVSGVLLPGADCDMDPSYYGQDRHPAIGKIVPEKDSTELLVLEEAERRGLPVFAICYGMQALNVFRGGSLIQDIPSLIEDALEHQQGTPLERNTHSVSVGPDGFLARIVEDRGADIMVNSHHHQAVGVIGENLIAGGWANDGIVEFIEDPRPGRFVIGTQWHPELSYRMDAVSRSLFTTFVERCTEAG